MELSKDDILWAMKRGIWWDDLRFPANIAGKGAQAPTWDTTNLGYIFSHNPPSNQELQWIALFPHGWTEGSTVEPHIHWALTVNGGAGEDVKWDMLYRVYESVGGSVAGAWNTLEQTIDVSAINADIATVTGFTPVSMSGSTLAAVMEVRLQRDTADAADDHAQDVLLKEFDIHAQFDQLGSIGTFAKWG